MERNELKKFRVKTREFLRQDRNRNHCITHTLEFVTECRGGAIQTKTERIISCPFRPASPAARLSFPIPLHASLRPSPTFRSYRCRNSWCRR